MKDVVLARAIDDSTFNVLNSGILFNQIDIINHVQADQEFLQQVVTTFLDEEMIKSLTSKGKELGHVKKDGDKMDVDDTGKPGETPHSNGSTKRQPTEAEVKRRREVLLLVQQLCVMGKNVQLPARMHLFRILNERGIPFAVQWGLNQPESDPENLPIICAAGEILTALLDHDLGGIRSHVLKQHSLDDQTSARKVEHDTIVSVMCRVLVRSKDLAVQSQIAESLRVMLETPTNDALDQHVSIPTLSSVFRRLISSQVHG